MRLQKNLLKDGLIESIKDVSIDRILIALHKISRKLLLQCNM
jgi:hypothetical protein